MTETPSLPLFLHRDGLLPAADLVAQSSRGLVRTTTVFGQQAWLVCAAEDIRRVLGDPEMFTVGDVLPHISREEASAMDVIGAMVFMDPPAHTTLRRKIAPRFSRAAMTRRSGGLREAVDAHVEALASHGSPADLVSHFARPLPAQIICDLLGLPSDQRDNFAQLNAAATNFTNTAAERFAAVDGIREMLEELVQRARTNPGDDILSELIADHGDDMSTAELVGVGGILLQAGHDTTSSMIASSILALLTHPDQLVLLGQKPELIGNAVEELLRYLTVVQINPPRRAMSDTQVGGQTVARGDLLLVSLPAGNHDPSWLGQQGDGLQLTRPEADQHLAFSTGIHRCLGAPLARMQLSMALPHLLRRFPDLHLTVDPNQLTFAPGTVVHALTELPVAW